MYAAGYNTVVIAMSKMILNTYIINNTSDTLKLSYIWYANVSQILVVVLKRISGQYHKYGAHPESFFFFLRVHLSTIAIFLNPSGSIGLQHTWALIFIM